MSLISSLDSMNAMELYLGTLTRMHTQQGLDPDEAVVADAVSRWIYRLNKELPYAVDWNESPTAPFEKIEMGEAILEFLIRAKKSHVKDIQLWLPIEISEPFELRLLDEQIVNVASSQKLHDWSVAQSPESIFRDLTRLSRRSVDFKLPLLMHQPANP